MRLPYPCLGQRLRRPDKKGTYYMYLSDSQADTQINRVEAVLCLLFMYAGGQRGRATERALRLLSRSLALGGGKSSENCIGVPIKNDV